MKRAFELLSLGLVSALVFSCGGGRPTAPSGNITSTAAKGFVESYNPQMQKGANPYNASAVKDTYISSGTRGAEYLAALLTETLPPQETRDLGCTPTEGGDKTDADKDGVPVNGTFTFSGCAATVGTFSGGFSFKDLDDTKAVPLAGFKFNIDSFKFDFSVAGTSVNASAGGFFNATVTDKTAVVAEEITFNVSAGSNSAELGVYLDTTLTANSATNPDTGGTATFSGFFKVNAGSQGDYTLQISSADLTYGCTSDTSHFFKNGTITAIDGSKNTIKGVFNNCASTWTYNDAALTTVSR